MGNIDWHFCIVGFHSPSIGDAQLERTCLFDGERLRSLRDLTGEARCELFPVAGCDGYMPAIHKDNAKGSLEAQASVVIVESVDGKYSAALGFEQSYAIFSNPDNKCFHADPYFGPTTESREERRMLGKLYLMAGSATDAFEGYREDF